MADSLPRYYSVLMNVPAEVGECFTYAAREPFEIGMRVRVPFGRREDIGYVVGDAGPIEKARFIEAAVDPEPLLTPELLDLTRWISRRCLATWYACVETAVPAVVKRVHRAGRERRVLTAVRSAEEASAKFRDDERILSAYRMILEHPASFTASDVMSRCEISRSRIDTLLRNGWLSAERIFERRDPFASAGRLGDSVSPPALTDEQVAALVRIEAEEPGGEVLLSGVTGSGKTEVYLQAIARALAENRSAILLVPEISLTPQTVDRIRGRFGSTVAILHSRLSDGERLDEWLRIRRGEARVVVGARSAIFAPVVSLGLVVIDEAHEPSYKQGESPRYHALDVARYRTQWTGARLILGTATPSSELSASSRSVAKLTRRIEERPMPSVTVVDMRRELVEGNSSIFSTALQKALRETLDRKEQAILFLNRRGHAAFVLCRGCGEAIRCPRCSVSLTRHEAAVARVGQPLLVCHMCNHRSPQPPACPRCGSRAIRTFGAGTQRIEEEVRRRLPSARVIRMDADTTAKKGAHREILEAFAAGEYDILVGTQMIGKGLDLPRVTLVGVVAADSSLHLPDFRAAERTFSMLVQVVGRSGRSDLGGRAVIQTYQPDHPAIVHAAAQDVDAFNAVELDARRRGGYPPFTRIIQWTFESESDEAARENCRETATRLADLPGAVLGPAPAPIERLRGRHRWQVRWFVKPDMPEETIRGAAARLRELKRKDVRMIVDVEPLDLM